MKVQLWGSLAFISGLMGFSWIIFKPHPQKNPKIWEISTEAKDWHEVYNGYGSNFFHPDEGVVLEPKPAHSRSETHANLVLVRKTEIHPLKDFVLTAQISTERQLRTPKPNPWEVLWFFFNCQPGPNEALKTNYFMIKPNGIEIGKAFNHVKQKILLTRDQPRLVLGKTYSITLIKVGTHIDALVDGIPILSTAAHSLPIIDSPGAIGIYTEDARAHLFDLSILPLNEVSSR